MKNTLTLLIGAALLFPAAANAQQLPDFNFDNWSKSGKTWNLWAQDAPAKDQIWDTANHGLSILGINPTQPEYEHVKATGPGKAACKMESVKAMGKFVAGNLYTGKFLRVVKMSGAVMDWGTPFTSRPKSMSGYVHYIPATVNCTQAPFQARKGKKDIGRIEVILTDWTAPYEYNSIDMNLIDLDKDPHIIGRGWIDLTEDTGGYIPVDIPITYRSDKKPTYVHVTFTSSRDGAYFTGGVGSVLYADEFEFKY